MHKNLNLDKELEEVEVLFTKCKNCGSNMVFDPETQNLKCIQCQTVESFSKSSAVLELDVEDVFLNGEMWEDNSSIYRCENCGAVVVLSANEIATSCPYCLTSIVVKPDEILGLKPNAVYPFKISKSEGLSKVIKWAKGKFFSPSKFKNNINVQDLKGVYEPAFTFDSNTHSSYYGRIGKYHTRVVGSGKNRRTERYLVWRTISGNFTHFFDDVFVLSGNKERQEDIEKLGGYDYSTIQVYSSNFLKGFMASRSEIPLKDCWNIAKSEIDKRLKKLILLRYNYDVVDYLKISTSHERVNYKSVLLPIYHMKFNYKNKQYKVMLNGNTGKIVGETPISLLKLLLTIFVPFGFIVAIIILISLFT